MPSSNPELREYFTAVSPEINARGNRIRFKDYNEPPEWMFVKLFKSLLFRLNRADRAKTTGAGHAVVATDVQAKAGTSLGADVLNDLENTNFTQPHHLPTVSSEAQNINLTPGTDFAGVAIETIVDPAVLTRNNFITRLSAGFITWLQGVFDAIQVTLAAYAVSIAAIINDINTIETVTIPAAITTANSYTNTQITNNNSEATPIGVIMPYSFAAAPNAKWRIANGFVVLAANYPDFHAALIAAGSPFGVSGADPLAPNTLNKNLRHVAIPGANGGADTAALIEANLPLHTHGAGTLVADSAGAHTHSIPTSGNAGGNGEIARLRDPIDGSNNTDSAGAHTHVISGATGNGAGTAQAFSVVNAYAGINCIVRVLN